MYPSAKLRMEFTNAMGTNPLIAVGFGFSFWLVFFGFF